MSEQHEEVIPAWWQSATKFVLTSLGLVEDEELKGRLTVKLASQMIAVYDRIEAELVREIKAQMLEELEKLNAYSSFEDNIGFKKKIREEIERIKES